MSALAAGPSYALFVLILMPLSAIVTRTLGWRTPPRAEMRIADSSWPLLDWARYAAANHVVRVLAGQFLRGTPPWTAYLRLCGARIGRRVYVNSLSVSDYNLLEFGDDVVIGADAHIAGHTVERGMVKTAPVTLGPRVTVGVGSIVDIGVTIGADCEIGALSLVPKHVTLERGGVYVGVPARRLERRPIESSGTQGSRARVS
jgi:acetyltransferase-like isoleucine patch superfamily enzyme